MILTRIAVDRGVWFLGKCRFNLAEDGNSAVALREVAYCIDGVLDVLCARVSVISSVQTKTALPVGLGGNTEVDARALRSRVLRWSARGMSAGLRE